MGLNTGAVGKGQGSTTHYGHADYERDIASGMSDWEIKKLIDADPSKMGNGGVTGQLYKQISSRAKAPSSGGSSSGGTFKKAYGKEFQDNLSKATEAYKPEEKTPALQNEDYKGLGNDFNKQLDREQAISDSNPFNDSTSSADFFGKHLTMMREAQKGRGDASSIVDKYAFNAIKNNPFNLEALDKQIRQNPLYSQAKSTLAMTNIFGDQHAYPTSEWTSVTPYKESKGPDLQKISNNYLDRIDDISL